MAEDPNLVGRKLFFIEGKLESNVPPQYLSNEILKPYKKFLFLYKYTRKG